jgi:hypothetical protein
MDMDHEEIKFTRPPDCNGWSWKQVIMGGLLGIAMAINRVANAIHETAGH